MYQSALANPVRKAVLCILVFLSVSLAASAQSAVIKGQVADSSEKKNLVNSSVSVLRKADSVLVAFTRSDEAGNFTLKALPKQNYLILITHPKYADYLETIDLTSNSTPDLGKIFLTLKSQLLQEVIVKNVGAIRIKGDTTEFKADSFYLHAGATVEDMLKKLPGMQVDKDGKIVFQGEAVQKVLVDGEEFFSDDPTIVTKNMLSDAIDRVQVYDKKSDQAAFTGIDDGQKTKTIDLKLKENRKQGYFGKIEVGSDLQKYWDNKGMLNAFKGKRKIALFGITSNTGKTGLDFDELLNYGSGGMEVGGEEGQMYISIGGGDDYDGGSFYGEGIPKAWNVGGLYSNKWNGDKVSMNTSLQYKKLNTEAQQATQSKYILPDTLYYINERGSSYSSRIRNVLSGTYEYKLDSSSNLKVTANGFTGTTNNVSSTYQENLDEDGKFVNTSNRNVSAMQENKALNTSLVYRKKFKKPGRTVSVNFNQNYNETVSEGLLISDYRFYDLSGAVKQQTSTDQQKLRTSTQNTLRGNISYTQPITKRSILEFNYGLTNSNGVSSITTLEKTAAGSKYEDVVDSLTNNYGLNVLTNAAGVNYRYAKPKKINFSFGANMSRADFTRTDRRVDTSVNYSFTNIFPRANINYTLANSANLSFYYYGNTRAPSIDQIQPIRDNTDELNQVVGNPNLKQAFSQQFSLSYDKYILLQEMYYSARISYRNTLNDFSTISFVDQLGKRITQPLNVDGNNSSSASIYFSKKIKNTPFRLNAQANASISHNTNFVNSIQNKTTNNNLSFRPGASYDVPKKFEISFSSGFNWTNSKSSIRPDQPTKYLTQDHYFRTMIFLPWKMEFSSDANFALRQKTDAFDRNRNAFQWNANLDKKILKEKGRIRISMFDILNQNIGFSRNVSSNFISERTYNRIQRYGMLSFIYNFSKNGQPQSW
jgi:hypothetical protein